jgi:drug/metabolite transporter (DMT)-like permease
MVIGMSRKALRVRHLKWVPAFPAVFVFLWATGFVGAKLGLPYAEPATFLSLRFALVLAILLPICWLSRAPWPTSREAVHMGVAGVLLQAGYLGGVFAAIHHGMPAGVSAVITGLQPLLTAVLAGWLLGERVNSRQWIGLVLGLAGVSLVVGERLGHSSMGSSAVFFALVALAGITSGTLWQKRHGAAVDLRTGAAVQFLAAAAVVAPFSIALESGRVIWSAEFVFALMWSVVVLSLGAIFLLLFLIRQGGATQVASLFYLVPPTTALIAWPLFGETYSLLSVLGMGLAVIAVWLVTQKR